MSDKEIVRKQRDNSCEKKPKIFIATISTDGKNRIDYTVSVVKTINYLQSKNIITLWYIVNSSDSTGAEKERAIADFVDSSPSFTHFMFISPNFKWEPSTIEEMLSFDKDIICAPVPCEYNWDNYRKDLGCNIKSIITDYALNVTGVNSIETVTDVISSSLEFCLIKREAISKLVAKNKDRCYYYNFGNKRYKLYGLFNNEYVYATDGKTKTSISGDNTFIYLWNQTGLNISVYSRAKISKITPEHRENRLFDLIVEDSREDNSQEKPLQQPNPIKTKKYNSDDNIA